MDRTDSQHPTNTASKPRKPIARLFVTLAIFVLTGVLLVRMVSGGGTAPAPGFMPATTDIASVAFEGNKPIVAIVTADWCPPCQKLKRDTLSDTRVQDLLIDRALPVIIDGTDGQAAKATLEQLRVRAFPSTVIVRDGQPVAVLEGYASADKYLAWLEQQL